MISIKKVPVIEVGQMVFWKEDPDKTPFKWRRWSDAGWNKEGILFCNPEEAKYKYEIEFRWKITL